MKELYLKSPPAAYLDFDHQEEMHKFSGEVQQLSEGAQRTQGREYAHLPSKFGHGYNIQNNSSTL